MTEESRKKMRISHTGKKYPNRKSPPPFTEEHLKKMRGHTSWNKGTKGIMKSNQTSFKKGNPAPKTTFKKGKLGKKGAECFFWKGGITPINLKARTSTDFLLWRIAVFTRDNFTCRKYGEGAGKLNAHHILNFAQFPELRYAIDNGITLSQKAHREFHKKYGIKNNTAEQLQEFLTN